MDFLLHSIDHDVRYKLFSVNWRTGSISGHEGTERLQDFAISVCWSFRLEEAGIADAIGDVASSSGNSYVTLKLLTCALENKEEIVCMRKNCLQEGKLFVCCASCFCDLLHLMSGAKVAANVHPLSAELLERASGFRWLGICLICSFWCCLIWSFGAVDFCRLWVWIAKGWWLYVQMVQSLLGYITWSWASWCNHAKAWS